MLGWGLFLCLSGLRVVVAVRWEWNAALRIWEDADARTTSAPSWSWGGSGSGSRGGSGGGGQCWHDGRWVSEGTEIVSGRFFYTCRGGRQEGAGCVLEDGRRVRLYETFVTPDGKYEKTCKKSARGDYLETQLTGCVHSGGRRARPGDSWVNSQSTAFYTCRQVNDWYLRAELGGCVNGNGRRLALAEDLEEGDTWFTCLASYQGGAKLQPRGCVHNGRRLNVGEQFPDGEFVYYCKVEGGAGRKMCVGCQAPSGQELYDGDRYFKDESIYQCDIRPDEFSHRLVGCVQMDSANRYGGSQVERVLGCHWYEEEGDWAWEMKCVEEGPRAIKETVGCIYKENGIERLSVPPKKFTLWYDEILRKNVAVACDGEVRGHRPRIVTFDPTQVRDYIRKGFTFTTPRGRKRK